MRIARLQLDYERSPSRARWAGWLALAVGLGATAICVQTLVDLRRDADALEWRLARLERKSAPVIRGTLKPADSQRLGEQIKYADGIAAKLTLPWDELFRAVEGAEAKDVALLSLEPDSRHRSLRITAEAKDKQAMLAYLASLASGKTLLDVHLIEHEVQAEAGQPVRFTLLASWNERGRDEPEQP